MWQANAKYFCSATWSLRNPVILTPLSALLCHLLEPPIFYPVSSNFYRTLHTLTPMSLLQLIQPVFQFSNHSQFVFRLWLKSPSISQMMSSEPNAEYPQQEWCPKYLHNLIQCWRRRQSVVRFISTRWMVSKSWYLVVLYRLIIITCICLTVAQVRVIFRLPQEYGTFPHPLAYVEWFTGFSTPVTDLGMYQISHSSRSHCRRVSIIPITQIKRSIHLIPKFGKQMDPSWTADDVLKRCKYFYVNCYLQHLDFLLFCFLMGI